MAARSSNRRTSGIIRAAVAAGIVIVLAGGAMRRMKHLRSERRCLSGDLEACVERCASRRRSCCEELARRCDAGEPRACEAREFVISRHRRLPF